MNNFKLLSISLILLTGCTAVPSDCKPALRQYTPEYQSDVANSLDAMQLPAVYDAVNNGHASEQLLKINGRRIKEMMDDYVSLRDQVRKCN